MAKPVLAKSQRQPPSIRSGSSFVAAVRTAREQLGLHWPRLFTSLRATRQTELIQRFGISVACQWIGNSRAIAETHYEMIPDEAWAQARSTVA